MKIFPRTHTRPWLCENGRILRSHQMNTNFFYSFFSLVLLLPFSSNGYVRLVVNWSFAICNCLHCDEYPSRKCFSSSSLFFAERTIYRTAGMGRQNKPLTMESNTKSIYTVFTQHSHRHRRFKFNFCPSFVGLSVCIASLSKLTQQSQSHEIINLKPGLDFRLVLKTSLSTCKNRHTHSYTVCLLKSVKTDSVQF